MSTAQSKRVRSKPDALPAGVQTILEECKPLEKVASDIVTSVNARDLPGCHARLCELLDRIERSILDGAPGDELRHQVPTIFEANSLVHRMGHSVMPFEIETTTGGEPLIYTVRFRISQPVYGVQFNILVLAYHKDDIEQPRTVGWNEAEKREAIAALQEWRTWAGRTTGPVVDVPYEEENGLAFASTCYAECQALLRGLKIADRSKKPRPATPLGCEKPRKPAQPRNDKFFEWYNDKDSDTYHSSAKIKERWNGMAKEERSAVAPWCSNTVTIEVVEQAIKVAKNPR